MDRVSLVVLLLIFFLDVGNSLQSNSNSAVGAAGEGEKANHLQNDLFADAEKKGNETKNDTKKAEPVHQNVQNWLDSKLDDFDQFQILLLIIVVILANVLSISFIFLCYFLYRRRQRHQQQNRGAQILLENGNNNNETNENFYIRMKTLESHVTKNHQQEKKL